MTFNRMLALVVFCLLVAGICDAGVTEEVRFPQAAPQRSLNKALSGESAICII